MAQHFLSVHVDSHPYRSTLLVMCFPLSSFEPSLRPSIIFKRVGPLRDSLTSFSKSYDGFIALIPAKAALKSRSAWCERISKSLAECMMCKRKLSQLLARLFRRWLVFQMSTTLSVRYLCIRGYPCRGDNTGKTPDMAYDDQSFVAPLLSARLHLT